MDLYDISRGVNTVAPIAQLLMNLYSMVNEGKKKGENEEAYNSWKQGRMTPGKVKQTGSESVDVQRLPINLPPDARGISAMGMPAKNINLPIPTMEFEPPQPGPIDYQALADLYSTLPHPEHESAGRYLKPTEMQAQIGERRAGADEKMKERVYEQLMESKASESKLRQQIVEGLPKQGRRVKPGSEGNMAQWIADGGGDVSSMVEDMPVKEPEGKALQPVISNGLLTYPVMKGGKIETQQTGIADPTRLPLPSRAAAGGGGRRKTTKPKTGVKINPLTGKPLGK